MVWTAVASIAISAYSAYQADQDRKKAQGREDRATRERRIAKAEQGGATEAQIEAMKEANRIANESFLLQQKAFESSRDLAQQNLDFNREQYQEQYNLWDDLYGDSARNQADFFEALDEESLIASDLSVNARAHRQMMEEFRTKGAQQGIDSPAMMMMENDIAMRNAENRAKIRNDAKFRLAEARGKYVQSGQGMRPGTGGVTSAYQTAIGTEQVAGQAADPRMIAKARETAGYGDIAGMFSGQESAAAQREIQSQRDIRQAEKDLGQAAVTGIQTAGYYYGQSEDEKTTSKVSPTSTYPSQDGGYSPIGSKPKNPWEEGYDFTGEE